MLHLLVSTFLLISLKFATLKPSKVLSFCDISSLNNDSSSFKLDSSDLHKTSKEDDTWDQFYKTDFALKQLPKYYGETLIHDLSLYL